jgi:hypothetical protein
VAQPVDRDGFLLIDKTFRMGRACLVHVALKVIPNGAIIDGLAIPSAFAHVTPEEWTDPTQRFERLPEQRDTVTGVDQGNHPLLIPLAHNPQVATIKVVELDLLHL